eukprot:gene35599-4449_t
MKRRRGCSPQQKGRRADGLLYRSVELVSGLLYRSVELVSGLLYRSVELVSGLLYRSVELVSGLLHRSVELVSGLLHRSVELVSGLLYRSAEDGSPGEWECTVLGTTVATDAEIMRSGQRWCSRNPDYGKHRKQSHEEEAPE